MEYEVVSSDNESQSFYVRGRAESGQTSLILDKTNTGTYLLTVFFEALEPKSHVQKIIGNPFSEPTGLSPKQTELQGEDQKIQSNGLI